MGWPEIEGYWSATRASLRNLESRCFDISASQLERNLALVIFKLAWRAEVDGPFLSGGPLGALVRVSAFLRRKDETWRFFVYVEGHIDVAAFAAIMETTRA